MAARPSRTNAYDRMIQVLDHLMLCGSSSCANLARKIKAPSSTVYKIANEMIARDILARDASGTVSLGPKLMYYGLAYQASLPFLDVAKSMMRELSARIEESVQLCGRDDDMMVVLAMAEAPGPFVVTSHAGTRVPLNWTASGRLLTGHLPLEERIKLFQRAATQSPTGRAETDPVALAVTAGKALDARLSVQVSESDYRVACIAAPITRPSGECVATISIVLPEARAIKAADWYAAAAQDAADQIEQAIGWKRVHVIGADAKPGLPRANSPELLAG